MYSPRTIAAAFALVAAWSAPALAHATLQDSTLQDGDELAANDLPPSFDATFDEPVSLAAVTLSTKAGKAVPLNFTVPHNPTAAFSVPMPKLVPGDYVFEIRGLSDDGHVTTETIRFSVSEEGDGGGDGVDEN
jgi:methionine-rich copper-binding protein CopC